MTKHISKKVPAKNPNTPPFTVHLDAGDAGATFKIVDKGDGPQIKIETCANGNLGMSLDIFTTPAGLKELAEMFNKAAAYSEWSEEFANAAEPVKIESK